MIAGLAARLRSALLHRLLGISAEEIRYTFEDVRRELRALRAEVATLEREVRRRARRPAGVDEDEDEEAAGDPGDGRGTAH